MFGKDALQGWFGAGSRFCLNHRGTFSDNMFGVAL